MPRSIAARHALAPCTVWRIGFPGYVAAAFAMFVSIRDQARLAAPWLLLWPLLSCDRGDLGGEGCAAEWRLAESLAGGTLAAGADSLAASSRRCAARELGLRRTSSLANSAGCCVATWARKPAAWYAFPQYLHFFFPKLRLHRFGFFLHACLSCSAAPFLVNILPQYRHGVSLGLVRILLIKHARSSRALCQKRGVPSSDQLDAEPWGALPWGTSLRQLDNFVV